MKVYSEGSSFWEKRNLPTTKYPILAYNPREEEAGFDIVKQKLVDFLGRPIEDVQGEGLRKVIVFDGDHPIGVYAAWFSGEFEEGEYERYCEEMLALTPDLEIPNEGCYGFWWVEIPVDEEA